MEINRPQDLQKPLDHETQPVVVLTIQAQLSSSPACSSTEVNITVIDVNDNRPVFPKASDGVTISQGTMPGTALYHARATDKDSGPNGVIRYTIASQSPSIFSVDLGLGVVYLNESLAGAGPRECTLTLMAQDLGVPPQASLLVLTVIIEKQEQNPSLTFEHLVYQAEVSELISWVALDHEQRVHHQVTVFVTDHGSPPRNATALVYVSVTDINDNRPYFPQCLPGKELHIK
ncbi:hypothetical protein J1605_010186, partial [Eschrichtius robustus]